MTKSGLKSVFGAAANAGGKVSADGRTISLPNQSKITISTSGNSGSQNGTTRSDAASLIKRINKG